MEKLARGLARVEEGRKGELCGGAWAAAMGCRGGSGLVALGGGKRFGEHRWRPRKLSTGSFGREEGWRRGLRVAKGRGDGNGGHRRRRARSGFWAREQGLASAFRGEHGEGGGDGRGQGGRAARAARAAAAALGRTRLSPSVACAVQREVREGGVRARVGVMARRSVPSARVGGEWSSAGQQQRGSGAAAAGGSTAALLCSRVPGVKEERERRERSKRVDFKFSQNFQLKH